MFFQNAKADPKLRLGSFLTCLACVVRPLGAPIEGLCNNKISPYINMLDFPPDEGRVVQTQSFTTR